MGDWNDRIISQLEEIKVDAIAHGEVNEEHSEFYGKVDNWLFLIVTVLTATVATVNGYVSLSSGVEGYKIEPLGVILMVGGIISTIINAYLAKFKPDVRSVDHARSANGFEELAGKINKELAIESANRCTAEEFLDAMIQKSSRLKESMPPISGSEVRKKKLKKD